MAVSKIKLGGTGDVTRVAREYIQPTKVYADTNLQQIASGISSIVQSVGKASIVSQRERDAEDKLKLTRKAQEESTDVDNAMQGASYDDNLNQMVMDWRSKGLTETEIRTKAKDYKYGKAITDFELDKGQEADDAINNYFEVFTDLEMKKITPLAQADRQAIQQDTADTIKANFMVGIGNFNDSLKESREVAKTYGISEDAVSIMAISSAFDRDRDGDPSMLEEIGTLKDSHSNRLIDTVGGRKAYNQLMDAKERRDLNRDAIEEKASMRAQEDNTNELFTEIVTTTDIASMEVKVTNALENRNINIKQYKLLMKQVDAMSPSNKPYAPYSDPQIVLQLQSKALLGTLSQEDMVNYAGALKEADYKSISKTAMKNGGLWGVGSRENDRLQAWIKNTAEAESGLGFEEAFKDDLVGGQKAKKLAGDIQYELGLAIDNFVSTYHRLPDKEEELEKISKDIKVRAKARLDKITAGKTDFPTANATPEQISTYVTSSDDWETNYATLTTAQRAKYKSFLVQQQEDLNKPKPKVETPAPTAPDVEIIPQQQEVKVESSRGGAIGNIVNK